MEISTIDLDIVGQIKNIIEQARRNVNITVNHELLHSYHQIGKLIVERKQTKDKRDMSERAFMISLSKSLSAEIGRGFSRANLINMKKFYENYPDGQTLSDHLSWSHYCEIMTVSDKDAKSFYENECVNANWTIRELRRQIDSALFQRLLLSEGTPNKQKVLELSRKGQNIEKPVDIIKDPYVLEFLGLPEKKPIKERALEKRLVACLEDFLLELGRGFMFVGSQQRITINNKHYHVDMVFYNKILRAYVLIDLKIGTFNLENVGQMNGYVNYYKTEINEPDDNPPIGIILCADKDAVVAEYALGGLENQIFASKYTYYLPDKEQLIKQIESVLEQEHTKPKKK